MTPEEIRIECLKLAHRHDREPAQVVETAQVYERFVANNRQSDATEIGNQTGRPKLGLPKADNRKAG